MRRRPLRWPWLVTAGSLASLTAAQLVPSPPTGPMLLIGGVDSVGLAYLLCVLAGLLGAVGGCGLAYSALRGRTAFVGEVLYGAGLIVVILWCTCGGVVALLVLGFGDPFGRQYRGVGTVDGRPVVVQLLVVPNGAAHVDAGTARGPLLDLRGRDAGTCSRFPGPLATWRFSVATSRDTIRVAYHCSSERGPGSGVVILARHP